MNIEITQNDAYTAIQALSKTIARKRQDLRREQAKLKKAEENNEPKLSKFRKSVFQRMASIAEFQALKDFLEIKIGFQDGNKE